MPTIFASNRRFWMSLWVAAAVILQVAPAGAADLPKRISIIVPASPGSLVDTSSRMIAEKLASYWGVAVIVENRPGGNMIIGTRAVAQGPADGSQILAGLEGALIVNPIFESGTPYSAADFQPLGQVWDTSLLLVSSKSLPARNFVELDAYAKANGRKINYPSGSTHNDLHANALKDAAGWDFTNVPYKGNVERIQSLMSGETHFTLISTGYAAPMVKGGKLNAVFVTSAGRSPDLPDVPTAAEAGLKNFLMSSWGGLFVSSKVSQPLRDKMREGVQRALAEPDVKRLIVNAGAETGVTDMDAFRRRMQDDEQRWKAVAKKHNIPTYR